MSFAFVCGFSSRLLPSEYDWRSETAFPAMQKRKAQISVSKVHAHPVTRPVGHNAPLCTSAALILGMCWLTFVASPPSCALRQSAALPVIGLRQTDDREMKPSLASESC